MPEFFKYPKVYELLKKTFTWTRISRESSRNIDTQAKSIPKGIRKTSVLLTNIAEHAVFADTATPSPTKRPFSTLENVITRQ